MNWLVWARPHEEFASELDDPGNRYTPPAYQSFLGLRSAWNFVLYEKPSVDGPHKRGVVSFLELNVFKTWYEIIKAPDWWEDACAWHQENPNRLRCVTRTLYLINPDLWRR
jgi:hypothetical protein